MTIELALIFGLIAALAFLVWEYIRLHHQVTIFYKQKQHSAEIVHRKALAILDEARDEATKIIKEARIGAVTYRDKLSSKMEAALDKVANREINDFKNALESETINIEKAVGQKIAARYDEVKQEIEDYKAKQIAGVDAKINQAITTLLPKILSRAIDPKEHQDLVIKSLEEARKNGLFD